MYRSIRGDHPVVSAASLMVSASIGGVPYHARVKVWPTPSEKGMTAVPTVDHREQRQRQRQAAPERGRDEHPPPPGAGDRAAAGRAPVPTRRASHPRGVPEEVDHEESTPDEGSACGIT